MLLLAAPSAAAAQTVTVVQTTANLHDALTVQAPQAFVAKRAPGSTVIRGRRAASRYQRILGFGGAMTDSSAWLLHDELAPAARGRDARRAVRGQCGIDLDYVRIPIGASDYVAYPVSRTRTTISSPFGHTDPTLAHFSIAHDEAYIIPASAGARRSTAACSRLRTRGRRRPG